MRREIVCYKITDNSGDIFYVPLIMDVQECLDNYSDYKRIECKKVIARFTSKWIYESGEYRLNNCRGLQKINLKVATYYYIDSEGEKVIIHRNGFPETKKGQAGLLKEIQKDNNYVIKYEVDDFPCYISTEKLLKLSDIEEVG